MRASDNGPGRLRPQTRPPEETNTNNDVRKQELLCTVRLQLAAGVNRRLFVVVCQSRIALHLSFPAKAVLCVSVLSVRKEPRSCWIVAQVGAMRAARRCAQLSRASSALLRGLSSSSVVEPAAPPRYIRWVPVACAAVLASGVGWAASEAKSDTVRPPGALAAPGPAAQPDGAPWPHFTRAQVASHASRASCWVTYRGAVYDVTDFVNAHPGGADKLLQAAGGSVDAYWSLYPQHVGSAAAVAALAARRVGTLCPRDAATEAAALPKDDPYAGDPGLHPALKLHARAPATAEPPLTLLAHAHITPSDLWFVRSHHPVPPCATAPPEQHVLTLVVGGASTTLTLAQLRADFPKRTLTATTQCGGNRRAELSALRPTAGISWSSGAISTARWAGASLEDVLAAARLPCDGTGGFEHVVFEGADGMSASVPLSNARNVLLAYEMNGGAIPAHHGAPLRCIAPGVVGVRSVKWLTSVKPSMEEATGPWQRGMAYKPFPPSQLSVHSNQDVSQLPSIQEQPVTSAICAPAPGETVPLSDEVLTLRGYAYSGGGRGIVRVDVSVDEGATWSSASLDQAGAQQQRGKAWAWTLWEATVALPTGARAGDTVVCVCKATDEAMNTQPERVAPIWNLRGLNCNAWGRVEVTLAPQEQESE